MTTQQNEIAVGENALLEHVPDAIIPFAGSRFMQKTAIHLANGAGLFWWEILAPGREASGELFVYEQFEMRTRIVAHNRTIAAENARLVPGRKNISSSARFGAYRYSATFYICHVGRDGQTWREAESNLRILTSELSKAGETLWGVSTLLGHGLVVRCLATQGREVLPGLHAIWKRAKIQLFGCEAIPPRKVN